MLLRKVLLDSAFKTRHGLAINVEFPVEVRTHFALHLIDLPEREQALRNNSP